jgi:hypothetical protein
MDRIYPAGPASVPDNLTAPTAAYKQRAWIALAGLALFVVLYLFLSGWFAWTAWRLISGALEGGKNVIFGWGLGLSAAFLAVFMVKALVFVKHGGKSDDTEITAVQQPELFAFIPRLMRRVHQDRIACIFRRALTRRCFMTYRFSIFFFRRRRIWKSASAL